MYVRAIEKFNYGGIVKMNSGDCREVKDDLANKMIKLGLVKKHNPDSYKKIKIKADNTIELKKDDAINKASDES